MLEILLSCSSLCVCVHARTYVFVSVCDVSVCLSVSVYCLSVRVCASLSVSAPPPRPCVCVPSSKGRAENGGICLFVCLFYFFYRRYSSLQAPQSGWQDLPLETSKRTWLQSHLHESQFAIEEANFVMQSTTCHGNLQVTKAPQEGLLSLFSICIQI